jgi:hypothetical protein
VSEQPIILTILNNPTKNIKDEKIIINTISIVILLLMVNCSKDDFTFGSLQVPSNLQVGVELIGKTAANQMVMVLVKLSLQQLQIMQYPINLFS